MATETVTSTTQAAPVLDRYGRPCPIAEALRLFDGEDFPAMGEARELDTYRLVHGIAEGLSDLVDRLETIGHVLEMLPRLMGADADPEARAAVDMAVPYRVETGNRAFELSGQVLAALERGGLLQTGSSTKEAANV